MKLRLLTAAVALPIVLGAVWLGGGWLAALAALAASLGAREFCRLTPPGLGPLPAFPAMLTAAAFPLAAWRAAGTDEYLLYGGAVLAAGASVSLVWYWMRRPAAARTLLGGLLLLAAPLYAGGLLAHGIALRSIGDTAAGGDELGRAWLLLALLVVMASDTGALAVGRTIGRHPMAPRISPAKTWEGAAGGMAAAIAAAVLLGLLLDLGVPVWQTAAAGAVIGLAGQLGDLLESRLKRAANAKDSGALMPGHGGMLDRLDSILLALPAAYYLLLAYGVGG